ncbi:MAG: DUF1585 domain-containing protein [Polyangiales bacterium]
MRRLLPTLVFCALSVVLCSGVASAERTRQEYRHFRALSIDLQGRVPTEAELTSFERPDFDLNAWIDQHTSGPAYAERLRRVYMDLLRLEVDTSFNNVAAATRLRRVTIRGANGSNLNVYWRRGQRRANVNTDGDFCLTPRETGLALASNGTITGTAINVSDQLLNERTVLVRPWWLYRDYRSPNPTQRISPTSGDATMLQPITALLREPDNRTDTTMIRVCREEAQTAATGPIYRSGRGAWPRATPYPEGRLTAPPGDQAYARTHEGEAISCTSGSGFLMSDRCGCGVGLERCLPGTNLGANPPAFSLPDNIPLGAELPLDAVSRGQSDWIRYWSAQEAVRFLDELFGSDRDVREIMTGRWTMANGPVAQFYRSFAAATCCTNSLNFNYVEPEPLTRPESMPTDLTPHDVSTWRRVADRGPRAAGILTMPIFLTKYGTRRARAHVVYQAFQCREFIAENVALTPSTEPNLMVRSGCAACHNTLEPLSAYFTRVAESGWNWIPASTFPAVNPACAMRGTSLPSGCATFYDPQFADTSTAMIRGGYGSTANADLGPAGLAAQMTASPEFAQCVVTKVTESFLGRTLTAEDSGLHARLVQMLRGTGFRTGALVRALVRDPAYREANNLTPEAWRLEQGGAR